MKALLETAESLLSPLFYKLLKEMEELQGFHLGKIQELGESFV